MDRLRILERYSNIAMVGLSSNPYRPSHFAAMYMSAEGYNVIPVNPRAKEILGRRSYGSLKEIQQPVEIVDIFRASKDAPPIVEEAIEIGAKVVWMQLGVIHYEAARACTRSRSGSGDGPLRQDGARSLLRRLAHAGPQHRCHLVPLVEPPGGLKEGLSGPGRRSALQSPVSGAGLSAGVHTDGGMTFSSWLSSPSPRQAAVAVTLASTLMIARIALTYPVFSATMDEGLHIAAGVEVYQESTYTALVEQPPLVALRDGAVALSWRCSDTSGPASVRAGPIRSREFR